MDDMAGGCSNPIPSFFYSFSATPALTMEEDGGADFEASALGTLDYWNQLYDTELSSFVEHGQEGESWFGSGCETRLIKWFEQNVPKHHSIVDIGCGNGAFLSRLHEAGYMNLCGLDYSLSGIHLAQSMLPFTCPLLHIDILDEFQLQSSTLTQYDVVFDKGIFDAISLQDIKGTDDRMTVLLPKYIRSIKRLLNPNGSFVITSCNWSMANWSQCSMNSHSWGVSRIAPSPMVLAKGRT